MTAGWLLVRRYLRTDRTLPYRQTRRTETQLREALAADTVLGRRAIGVGTIADGIVELTGVVRDEGESKRAVTVAERIPGVRTVLNRLDDANLEEHLAAGRQRLRDGDPSMLETHWYGQRVGMGRRRQGRMTDPDRTSDRVPILSRELGTDRAVEEASEPMDKLPAGVEGHTSGPAAPTDRGTVADAPRQQLGNVPPDPLQDLNPDARVIQDQREPGIELTLEESGLERELQAREEEMRADGERDRR